MSENYTSKTKKRHVRKELCHLWKKSGVPSQFLLAKGSVPISFGSISRCFLLSEILQVRSSGFWQHVLNKIGGDKNPVARVRLSTLVNAYMGKTALKPWAWVGLPGHWGQRCSKPNGKGRQGWVRTCVRATWGTTGFTKSMSQRKENILCDKLQVLWSCSLILLGSTFAFAWRTHRLGWAWKEWTALVQERQQSSHREGVHNEKPCWNKTINIPRSISQISI